VQVGAIDDAGRSMLQDAWGSRDQRFSELFLVQDFLQGRAVAPAAAFEVGGGLEVADGA
jgi:hypothetical protein